MLLTNLSLRYSAIEHLVKMVRVGMHENGLTCSAGRKIRYGGLRSHVPKRIHSDAEMGQEGLGQSFAEGVIDRGTARWDPITSAISSQCSKKGAVRGAGMQSMQPIDNMQALLVGLQRLDGLWQYSLGQGTTVFHACRNTGHRIKPLVLKKEDHSFRAPLASTSLRKAGEERGPSSCCGHSLQ